MKQRLDKRSVGQYGIKQVGGTGLESVPTNPKSDRPEGIGKDADNTTRPVPISPYYTTADAAAYLRTTLKAIYGLVERGQLKRCPGPKRYLFTREMLDDYVLGQGLRPTKRSQIK